MARKSRTALLLVASVLLAAVGARAEVRITGGKPAPAGRFSYAAAIFSEDGTGADRGTASPDFAGLAEPLCGGVRIGRAAVLTTASCVVEYVHVDEGGSAPDADPLLGYYGGNGGTSERLRVTLGARPFGQLDPAEEDWFDRGLPVRHIAIHPDYDGTASGWATATRDNDIAILYLQYAPAVDNNYAVAALSKLDNQDGWFKTNRTLAAMGWGVTNDAGAAASGLRFAEIKRQPDEWCANTFRSHGVDFNREVMFCAGARSGTKKSSCLGDEGSPIIYNAANTASAANFPSAGPRASDVVVGLTTFGPVDAATTGVLDANIAGTTYSSRCATNNRPFVYTKVAQYADWVAQQNGLYDAELAMSPAVPANDAVEFAAKIKCPSKNSVQKTYNCYAQTNDFLGRPTSEGCWGADTASYGNAGGLKPNGDTTSPVSTYQGVWFFIDFGPGINPALQRKAITVSTCFSTFDTVLRAFKVNSAYNLTAGVKPDLDDCAGIGRATADDFSTGLEGEADAYADDNEVAAGTDCNLGTDSLAFKSTEDFEIDGTRWYFLVSSSGKTADDAGVQSFQSCGTAQLSCKSEAI